MDIWNTGEEERYVLLARESDGGIEVLAYTIEEGDVLCLFDTPDLAEAFAKVSTDVRGSGWRPMQVTQGKLPELIKGFNYVEINPSPQQNTRKELFDAPGFANSLSTRMGPGQN